MIPEGGTPRIITHPPLVKPTGEQFKIWGSLQPAMEVDWIRHVAPQFGLDARKLIRGHLLSNIRGDDSNSFSMATTMNEEDKQHVDDFPAFVRDNRAMFLERLNFEVTIPEIDDELRHRITQVRDAVQASDWTDEQSLQSTTQQWEREVRAWVNGQVEEKPEVREDLEFFTKTWVDEPGEFKMAYRDFLAKLT